MMTTEVTAELDAQLEAISRSTDLHALEKIIRKGRATFLEVGLALWRVREAKLYKLTHSSWESWIQDRWWASKRHADRQIAAARIVIQLGPNVPIRAESQARSLASLPEDDRVKVIDEAVELAGGDEQLTAAHVETVVDARLEKKKPLRLQTRRTPQWFYNQLNARFGPFKLDAFADEHNALCKRWYGVDDDGCAKRWFDVTFANPEFLDMPPPLEQALRQAERGVRSIMLGPVGCSQEWYHRLAIRGTIYVPDSRISYDTPDGKPTGVSECHNGLPADECRKFCKCINGADRDTIVMGFGGEHTNKSWRRGVFRVRALLVERRGG